MRIPKGAVGLTLGLLFTPIALALAVASAGAGHGDYLLARLLFPGPMLLTVFRRSITILTLAGAVIQYPLYGYAFGAAIANPNWRLVAGLFAASHLVALVACLSGVLSGFS